MRVFYQHAIIILLSIFIANSLQSATTISSGNVSGTRTTTGSPYKISGDITIANGTTLTIQPGVSVEFQGHYKLDVKGRLLAIGNSDAYIIFTALSPSTGWKGIRFN